jgi:hypothetical protein
MKRRIEARLETLCRKFGYGPYKMSRFEEYELYVRNKDFLRSDRVITFSDPDGRLLAMKPDVTLSIVKNAPETPGDVRKVYYRENVYRSDSGDFKETAFVPYTKVLEVLPELEKVQQDGGVASLYRLPEAKGNIGLISPLNAHFCGTCNRIRLTSDGKLKPCLHSSVEYPIKGLDREGMMEQFKTAIYGKPQWHGELNATERSKAGRNMNQIGG